MSEFKINFRKAFKLRPQKINPKVSSKLLALVGHSEERAVKLRSRFVGVVAGVFGRHVVDQLVVNDVTNLAALRGSRVDFLLHLAANLLQLDELLRDFRLVLVGVAFVLDELAKKLVIELGVVEDFWKLEFG